MWKHPYSLCPTLTISLRHSNSNDNENETWLDIRSACPRHVRACTTGTVSQKSSAFAFKELCPSNSNTFILTQVYAILELNSYFDNWANGHDPARECLSMRDDLCLSTTLCLVIAYELWFEYPCIIIVVSLSICHVENILFVSFMFGLRYFLSMLFMRLSSSKHIKSLTETLHRKS